MPSLLDCDALRNTKIILTDQDRELMGVIDSALKNKDGVYGSGVRRICKWHKVILFLSKKSIKLVLSILTLKLSDYTCISRWIEIT